MQMIDFNLAKESLIEHLNRSCENSDGTIFWCDGTMAALFAMMSLCFDIEHNHKIEVKPVSNADRIRSMTDEELADWLGVYCNGQTTQKVGKPCVSGMGSCEECWLDWLKEEVKDGT